MKLCDRYTSDADVSLYHGDVRDFIPQIRESGDKAKLIVTSPPYNLGKEYEVKLELNEYLKQQEEIIRECVDILDQRGSICWQVGNYVENGEVYPLDILLYPIFKKFGLKLRNRIIWWFGHGLHATRRFSGRYETIIWFTKSDDYYFNLDPVRIPQKYPGKRYYKGPKKGLPSCTPKGKNPSDVFGEMCLQDWEKEIWEILIRDWEKEVWEIPNVKCNHPEKTIHPCQFPVELVERLILSMTEENDLVFDPFIGVGSTAVAAVIHKRRAAGADINEDYIKIAKERVKEASEGKLRIRPMNRPIYEPKPTLKVARKPDYNIAKALEIADRQRLMKKRWLNFP